MSCASLAGRLYKPSRDAYDLLLPPGIRGLSATTTTTIILLLPL